MGSILRNIAIGLFGCLAIINTAYSSDYYWTVVNNQAAPEKFGDSAGACNRKIQIWAASNPAYGAYAFQFVTKINASQYSCKYLKSGSTNYFTDTVFLWGDACPSGGVFDPVTFQCKNPNKCAEVKGETFRGSVATDAGLDAPGKFSFHGCEAVFTGNTICKMMTSGVGNCNGPAKLTGEPLAEDQASAPDSPDCDVVDCEALYPPNTESDEPCNEQTVAGVTTCTSVKKTSTPGVVKYDNSKEPPTRIEQPKATSTEIKKTSTLTTTIEPDSSKKIIGHHSYQTTVCKGVADCETLLGESTETGGTNSDGSPMKPYTSCDGVACTDGKPPASGSGDGEGEEGEGGTASTAGDCVASPQCEGDPFQCAILVQAHIDTCKLMAGPTAAESADMAGKTAAEWARVDANQGTMDSQVNTLLSGFKGSTGGSGTGGGQCLPDVPFSVMGHGMKIEFSKACASISFVRMAILAMAYLFAARIVFREV